MTQKVHSQVDAGRGSVSGWAVGLAVFAGCMMIMGGLFGAIAGIAAIVDDDLYMIRGDYVFKWDVTAWGWIHLLLGIIVIAAGIAVLAGRTWARVVGIALAVLSAVANFMFLPYYPVWSIVIIALDIAVIWALARYSRQAAAETWG